MQKASKDLVDTPLSGVNGEFLTFRLGDEEYGIDILRVQEIRGCEPVTHLANAPDFIKGVINLRGVIVPIVDLRLKFNLENATYNEFTVVIIINVAQRVIGIVVDSVSDVVNLDPSHIRPAPRFNSLLDDSYILGIGMLDERLMILVDIETMMTSPDMALVSTSAQRATDHEETMAPCL